MSDAERLLFVIMRHGAIPANERRCYAGRRTDEPLSTLGYEQARAAGVCTELAHVYVSPLLRARQTAELCFPHAAQHVVEDLAEMDFGDFEGRSAQDMQKDAAYREWVDGMCESRCPGGESRDEFVARTVRAVEQIIGAAQRSGLSRVVIVAHGGTVMSAMSSLAQASPEDAPVMFYDWHVGNCQGYRAYAQQTSAGLRLHEPERFEDLGFLCP